MKKKFLNTVLALVICLTCVFMVSGCQEREWGECLTVSGAPTSVSKYTGDDGDYSEWLNTVFSGVKLSFTPPSDSKTEAFTDIDIKTFRNSKGGRVTFDAYSAGEKKAIFSYDGFSVEVAITVTEA